MLAKRMRRAAILVLALAVCLCWTALAGDDVRGSGAIGRLSGDEEPAGGGQARPGVEWIIDGGQGSATPADPKAWTFLVYLCGSDLGFSAKADLDEMAGSGFDASQINVVVFTGGAGHWGGEDLPTDRNTLLEIGSNTVTKVDEFPLADMSASGTLSHFLQLASERYPAERYALILWNHGAGPNGGLFKDVLYNRGLMSLEGLEAAMRDSPFCQRKLEIIGFDACLMAGIEAAKTMAPFARYMLASEESEPGVGWNYAFLGTVGSETAVPEIAEKVIDGYFRGIEEKSFFQAGENTMSCIDLERLEEVRESCAAFFRDADAYLNGDTYVEFARARDKAIAFGDPRIDLMDIGSFVKNLKIGEPASRTRLLNALEAAVIFNRSDRENVDGLSVYHPYNDGGVYPYFMDKYSGVAPSAEYSSYIGHFTDFLTGASQADWSGLSTLGRIKADAPQRDMNTNFTLHLTREQIDFMAEAALQVFESPDGGETFALVSTIPDVETGADNTLSADYVHRALFIAEGEGDAAEVRSPALPYDVAGNGLYRVEATLVGTDADGGEVRRPVRLLYALNETEKYDGELALQWIEALDESDMTYTLRHNLDLADFDSLEIARELRRPTTLDGTTLNGFDQWESASVEVCTMPLGDGWRLRMLHDVLEPGRIHVGFAIRDYQNRRYTSALIALVGSRPDVVTLTYDNDCMAAYMPSPTLVTDGAEPGMKLTLRVTNHSRVEDAVFRVANLRVNGRSVDLTLDILGDGPNEGLRIDEEEAAYLLIPAEALKGLGTVDTLDYDILILDASNGDSQVHAVPVHGALSVDVSAFG